MSAAAYNLESQWEIPAYVWPAVIGLSVAFHLAALVYGMPVLPWERDEPAEETETEFIIESGGPVFEQVAVETSQTVVPEAAAPADIVEPASPSLTPVLPSDVAELQPAASEPLPLVNTPLEEPQSLDVPLLEAETVTDSAVIEAQEVTSLTAETAPTVEVPSVDVLTAETVDVSQPETVQVPEVTAAGPETETVTLVQTDNVVPAVTQEPAVTTVTAQQTEPVTLTTPDQTELSATDVETVELVAPVDVGTNLVPVGEIDTIPLATDQTVADLAPGDEAVTQVTPVTTTAPAALTLAPSIETPIVSTPDVATTYVEPADTVELTQVAPPEIETITPVAQAATEVEQVETEVAALSPAEPETAAVPSVEAPAEPADIVPAVEVATIDPLANITSYVRNYDFGECAHLSVLSAGADSAEVTAFGPGIGPFAMFDQRFTADQGYEASIELRIVTRPQCALLDALGVNGGVEAAGLVELDKTLVRSGTLLTGLIQRDLPYARIAAAQEAGLDLGGKGPPELYLIDDAGRIHDGRDYLLPASSAQTAGAWRFKVPVHLTSAVERETALILAVWNRPASRQPPRFGTLPPSRIAGLLAEPGVYSLAAFKVSR